MDDAPTRLMDKGALSYIVSLPRIYRARPSFFSSAGGSSRPQEEEAESPREASCTTAREEVVVCRKAAFSGYYSEPRKENRVEGDLFYNLYLISFF